MVTALKRPPSQGPRDLAARLEPIRDRVDRLCAAAHRAPLSHQDYDRLEEDAAGIGSDLRAAFRGVRR